MRMPPLFFALRLRALRMSAQTLSKCAVVDAAAWGVPAGAAAEAVLTVVAGVVVSIAVAAVNPGPSALLLAIGQMPGNGQLSAQANRSTTDPTDLNHQLLGNRHGRDHLSPVSRHGRDHLSPVGLHAHQDTARLPLLGVPGGTATPGGIGARALAGISRVLAP